MIPTCKLDGIALKYGTDKSSENHNYCPLYEKHLPEKIESLLEIGVWKGASIKMFKEWYKDEGKFFAMDVFGGEVITETQLGAIGVNSIVGSQSDMALLKTIKEKFTVLVEDGSHHSDEQVITFRQMFKHNIAPGGLYVLEDAFCANDKYWWRGVVKKFEDTALGIFQKYLAGGTLECDFITYDESKELMAMIESVDIYNGAIIFIKKKEDA